MSRIAAGESGTGTYPRQFPPAPSDAEAEAAWDRIMADAAAHCLIVQAFGGVATLAIPAEQRKAGVRANALAAQLRSEVTP